MNQKAIDLSVVIITFNEEENLDRCLKSLPPGSEVIVLDSGSSDGTEAITRSFGASFHTRKFDHYAAQKNAAIDLATRRWVFSIDADEVMDSVARDSVLRLVTCTADARFSAYRMKRQLVFLGQVMRFGKTCDYPVRLFQREGSKFIEPIHERLDIPDSRIGPTLPGLLEHHSYGNVADYFAKFNLYTSKIATNHFEKKVPPLNGVIHCLRPFSEFISRYIFLFGFLDGRAGFSYALFSSLYAYVKYEKLWEMYHMETKSE
jgi:glycosyltransferase involved in cell wall biosynthesis